MNDGIVPSGFNGHVALIGRHPRRIDRVFDVISTVGIGIEADISFQNQCWHVRHQTNALEEPQLIKLKNKKKLN